MYIRCEKKQRRRDTCTRIRVAFGLTVLNLPSFRFFLIYVYFLCVITWRKVSEKDDDPQEFSVFGVSVFPSSSSYFFFFLSFSTFLQPEFDLFHTTNPHTLHQKSTGIRPVAFPFHETSLRHRSATESHFLSFPFNPLQTRPTILHRNFPRPQSPTFAILFTVYSAETGKPSSVLAHFTTTRLYNVSVYETASTSDKHTDKHAHSAGCLETSVVSSNAYTIDIAKQPQTEHFFYLSTERKYISYPVKFQARKFLWNFSRLCIEPLQFRILSCPSFNSIFHFLTKH